MYLRLSLDYPKDMNQYLDISVDDVIGVAYHRKDSAHNPHLYLIIYYMLVTKFLGNIRSSSVEGQAAVRWVNDGGVGEMRLVLLVSH